MLEPPKQHKEAVALHAEVRLVDPQTHLMFDLLHVDKSEPTAAEVYDDSPWSREELEALAWHNAERVGRGRGKRG